MIHLTGKYHDGSKYHTTTRDDDVEYISKCVNDILTQWIDTEHKTELVDPNTLKVIYE